MKNLERESAQQLRRDGHSLNEIVQRVPISKSTASLWVRDIELTPDQLQRLRDNSGHRAGRA